MKKIAIFLCILAFMAPVHAGKGVDRDIFVIENLSEEKVSVQGQIKMIDVHMHHAKPKEFSHPFKLDVKSDEKKSLKRSDLKGLKSSLLLKEITNVEVTRMDGSPMHLSKSFFIGEEFPITDKFLQALSLLDINRLPKAKL